MEQVKPTCHPTCSGYPEIPAASFLDIPKVFFRLLVQSKCLSCLFQLNLGISRYLSISCAFNPKFLSFCWLVQPHVFFNELGHCYKSQCSSISFFVAMGHVIMPIFSSSVSHCQPCLIPGFNQSEEYACHSESWSHCWKMLNIKNSWNPQKPILVYKTPIWSQWNQSKIGHQLVGMSPWCPHFQYHPG